VIVWHNNKPYQMVRAVTGDAGTVDVLPSAGAGWWNGGRGAADAWRLSGGLWHRHWAGPKQGGHRRMAEGIDTRPATPAAAARLAMIERIDRAPRRPVTVALAPDDRCGAAGTGRLSH
jgi:hypothetical protein